MRTDDELYRFHTANLRVIEDALERSARLSRHYVATNDTGGVNYSTRLYALLLGAWAECRLRKLLFEKNGFSKTDRGKILAVSTQFDCWEETVKIAFRKHYNISTKQLTVSNLPHSAFSQYETLIDIFKTHLKQIIEMRNKLAHGQWHYLLTNDGSDISQELMPVINKENILALQFKKNLIVHLSDLVNDLVVSKSTFDRDFDSHFKQIVQTKTNLLKRSYTEYKLKMQAKYNNGLNKKKSTTE